MRLTKLVIDKLGVFDHAEFEFPEGTDPNKADTYVFVGPNGSGKTTALLALAQFFSRYQTGVHGRMNSESVVALSSELAVAQFELESASPRVGGTFSSVGGFRFFGDRTADFFALQHRRAPITFGAFGYAGGRSLSDFRLTAIQETQFDEHGLFASQTQQFVQWAANTFAKIAFARQRGDLALAEQREATIRRVSEVVRSITQSPFELVLHDEPLAVRCKLDGGVEVELDVLPDGLKSILTWVGDLLMRIDRTQWPPDGIAPLERNHVVFLDEVEVHLHPKWQRKVLPALQTLLPKAQLFVTTHSPFVVASATDAFIYKLDQGRVTGPTPTSDGQSVLTILRDVLGVTEEFSDAVEAELTAFEQQCDLALKGDSSARAKAGEMAAALSGKGPELAAIAQRQLKLLDRQLASPVP